MDPIQLSEYASLFMTLIVLVIASASDLRTREVPDKLWLVYGPIGLALTLYRLWSDPETVIFTAISIFISILFAFALVFFGLAGGADAKALICLGLTLPLPPTIVNTYLGFVLPFFPLLIVITAYFASLSVAVWILGKNLIQLAKLKSGMFAGWESEPTWKKGLALVTGYPAQLAELRSTFYLYPMEKVVEDPDGPHRRLEAYSNADVDRAQVLSEFEESLKKVGSPNTVWVTPGLPLLVFFLVALLVALTVGDPVFFLIFTILKH